MSKPGRISFDLTQDQALVFFDWLTRQSESGGLPVAHQAEQDVLWVLEGLLEKSLVEPLKSDYEALVQAARTRLTSTKEQG